MRPTWDDTFFEVCSVFAKRSKDQSTQVGAVIVDHMHRIVSTGYNCFPRYINDDNPKRQDRPWKYNFFEHAERNAIYAAAANGIKLEGCKIYVSRIPCPDCVRGIIQSGIVEIIVDDTTIPEHWVSPVKASLQMICESGVILRKKNMKKDFSVTLLDSMDTESDVSLLNSGV